MPSRFLIALLTLSWIAIPARGDDRVTLFEARMFSAPTGQTLPYRLLSPPEVQPDTKYPLVIFFHGAGERGTDNTAQLVHVVKELATEEMRKRYPCFLVAPQCPNGHRWVEVDWSSEAHSMPEEPSLPMSLTIAMLENLKTALPIDADRIYVAGLSMGGYGTWDLLQRRPDDFAAAVPICGGGDPAFASRMKDIPIWVFHGDQDTVVKPARSRQMVDALRAIGAPVIHTEYVGVSHNSWAPTASNRLVWDWLFAQKRP